MILDKLENFYLYSSLPCFNIIKKFLNKNDILLLEEGEYSLNHDEVSLKIMEYDTSPVEELFFETHAENIDVQIILEGAELMQVAAIKDLEPCDGPSYLKGDFQFYQLKGEASSFIVNKGFFVVFFHDDAHRPSANVGDKSSKVRKAVFKIKRKKNETNNS